MSWVQVRWLEQRCEEGRVEKRWQEVRESEKRWDEVNRVELRWEEVNGIELRWEEMKNIENSCEKNWEGLRWCEKSCEELRSGRLSCKRVRQDDEFAEQSFEDARLHANSYRQTLSFTPTYSVTFLATGNFRLPAPCGFSLYIFNFTFDMNTARIFETGFTRMNSQLCEWSATWWYP